MEERVSRFGRCGHRNRLRTDATTRYVIRIGRPVNSEFELTAQMERRRVDAAVLMRRAYPEALGFANLRCSDGLDTSGVAELQSYPTEAVSKVCSNCPCQGRRRGQ